MYYLLLVDLINQAIVMIATPDMTNGLFSFHITFYTKFCNMIIEIKEI